MSLAISLHGNPIVSYLRHGSLRITRTVDGAQGLADFDVLDYTPDITVGLTDLTITDGGTTYFDGEIRSLDFKYTTERNTTHYQYAVHCQDDATADATTPDAPFDLGTSAYVNGSTIFAFTDLSVNIPTAAGGFFPTDVSTGKVSTWQPGLSAGEMIRIYGLSNISAFEPISPKLRIMRLTTTWPINATAPYFTLEVGGQLLRLEQALGINRGQTFFPETPHTGQRVFRSDL